MKYNKGDIVKVNKNAFKDNGEGYNCSSKGHLFVVMQNDDGYLTCCIISSVDFKVSSSYKYNIPIDDYKKAHLNKPQSHVKVDRQTIKIPEKYVMQKVGHLSNEDYVKIFTAFHRIDNNDIDILENLDLFSFLKGTN